MSVPPTVGEERRVEEVGRERRGEGEEGRAEEVVTTDEASVAVVGSTTVAEAVVGVPEP